MTFKYQIIEKLKKVAIESNQSRFKIASCIVFDGEIFPVGINRRKSHPFQAKYSRNENSIYLHAEIQAIVNALRFLDVEDLLKSDLYICRMKNIDGVYVPGLSKPCEGCFKAIVEFGIKNVYYTTNEGTVENL